MTDWFWPLATGVAMGFAAGLLLVRTALTDCIRALSEEAATTRAMEILQENRDGE